MLTLRVGSRLTEPPAQLCSTEADAALIPTGRLGPGTRLTMSSEDNRAESLLEPNGALVKLTVSLGEPLSVPAADNGRLLFLVTGFPQCTALLREQSVRCTGLVPGARYRLGRRRAQASLGGTISVGGLRLRGGDALALVNSAGRRLTTLHVAHLRVHIIGRQTRIASGTCQPGDFYGPPLSKAPVSDQVGDGVLGRGTVCPADGSARGCRPTTSRRPTISAAARRSSRCRSSAPRRRSKTRPCSGRSSPRPRPGCQVRTVPSLRVGYRSR